MIPKLIIHLLIITYGVVLPTYWSHKALRANSLKEIKKWLIHWIMFTLFLLILDVTNLFFSRWLPFYNELVLIAFFCLICPRFQGSNVIYKLYLKPMLVQYEKDIDSSLDAMGKKTVEFCMSMASNTFTFAVATIMHFLKEGNFTLPKVCVESDREDGDHCPVHGTAVIDRLVKPVSGMELDEDIDVMMDGDHMIGNNQKTQNVVLRKDGQDILAAGDRNVADEVHWKEPGKWSVEFSTGAARTSLISPR